MRMYKRVIFTCIGSIGISLILMWIVQQNRSNGSYEMGVIAYPMGSQLSEYNIVDYMAGLPLQLRIDKIEWEQSILSVDLLSIPGSTIDKMVFHDLYELSQFGLRELTNVSQVRVRIVERKQSDANTKELLVAMDSRKENIADQKQKIENLSTLNKQTYLQSHFRITYTQKWKDQFVD
jgi:hypothetical protein